MFRKSALIVLVIFLLSAFISGLVGEFIVRGVFPQITYKQARVVGLRIFESSDTQPLTLKPNLQTNHLGYTREFDHKVRINNLGFRGQDMTIDKPQNKLRILTLGDSMTFGWGVEDNQAWPFLTQEYLNQFSPKTPVEIINAGFTDGYSPDSYYVFLNSTGVKLMPDMAILTLFPYNDIPDLLEMEWQTDSQGYPVKVQSQDRAIRDGYQTWRYKTEWKYEIPFLKNSQLAMLLFQALERNSPEIVDLIKKIFDVHEPPNRTNQSEVSECLYKKFCAQKFIEPWEKTMFLIRGFKELAEKNNFRLMVLLMPSPDQAKPVSEKVYQNFSLRPGMLAEKEPAVIAKLKDEQPQKDVRDFLDQQGIVYFDLLPVLSDLNSKAYFYGRDGHLTATGTQRVSEALGSFIFEKQNWLLPAYQGNQRPQ